MPKNGEFYAEFVYKIQPVVVVELDAHKVLGIDPGLNNWPIPFFYEAAWNQSFTEKDLRLPMECNFIVNWYNLHFQCGNEFNCK